MVTSRDVARLAGVSQATVSRAMSSSSQISPTTRARVLAAMAELGYVPHAGAQAMKTRRTKTVGVVVADLVNPFYSEMLDELTAVLSDAGYRVVVWNAASGSHADALQAIGESAVDGVVFLAVTASSIELQAAVERGSPLVLINRIVDDLECDRVSSDNLAGGTQVADFLVEHGRTAAAFLSGGDAASTSRDRGRGFLDRMSELGHPVPEHMRAVAAFSHDQAAQATRRLLTRSPRPTAIFCANDNMAFGALDTIRELGMTPEDCWVVGYDDVAMASWSSLSLTTVRQPSREMAAAGARLLLQRLEDPQRPPEHLRFPCALIVRDSTPVAAR